MRKKQLKKIPFRHWHIMNNRKEELKTIIDSRGHSIVLNLAKHDTLKGPYQNEDYQRELDRFRFIKRKAEETKYDKSRVDSESKKSV
jgi:hypothetical protein